MKYGKISLLLEEFENINLGDVLQDYACDYLYQTMNVDAKDVVTIPYNDIFTYDGEYVVVPVYNTVLDAYFTPYHIFSPKIIPVFLGLTTDLNVLPEEMVIYLRRFEPIGCRDEYTLNIMREHNIMAYLGGCITTILPNREKYPSKPKVFFTDIPPKLKSYIPQKYLEMGEFTTQVVRFHKSADRESRKQKIYHTALEFYKRYADEAALVVTSRLHSTLPCLAMGIPVILVRDEMWKTFRFVDRYVRIYMEGQYDKIDWMPTAVDYSQRKKQILSLFQSRLRDAYDKYCAMFDLSAFYEEREKTTSGADFEVRIDNLIACVKESKQGSFRYIIWGAGVRGHMVYARMKKEFPKAQLAAYVDIIKKGTIDGIRIISPDQLSAQDEDYIIICNNTGEEQAVKKMAEMGKKERLDFFSTNIKNEGAHEAE